MVRTPASRETTRRAALPAAPALPMGWVLVRRSGIAVLQAKPIQRISWLAHGFSTRPGGAGRIGSGQAMNLGYVEGDERGRVDENRRLLARVAGARGMDLVAMRQLHSSMIRVIEGPPGGLIHGDALVTRAPKLLLAVQTADCVPILIVDPRRRVVAAIHAGWRGTLARIAEKAVGEMRMHFDTRPENAIAAIGPSIGGCCYEVGPDVAQAFAAQFPQAGEWFDGPFGALSTGDEATPFLWLQRDPPGHARPKRVLLDLVAANRWQLAAAGLRPERILACGWCTACHSKWLFSYRREGQRAGRMLAVVGLRR